MKKMIMLVLTMLGISLFGDSVWIEGENFDGVSKLTAADGVEKVMGGGKGYQCTGWGNANVMSEGKVIVNK
jgi:hypothetical protein